MLLGDAASLLKKVVSKSNLRQAFRYAHHDRQKEWFYDPFELEWAEQNESKILQELADELRTPLNYAPSQAYAYFTPKNELCYRRMIYIPFKDLVLRYAIAAVVADLVDCDLSPKCFANRRDSDPDSGLFLADFATVSWPRFCTWQRDHSNTGTYPTLLRTDISAFYDAISHKYLVSEIADSLSVDPDSKFMRLFLRLLQVPVLSYSHVKDEQRNAETMHQGLCIGNSTEGFFANVYLRHIDRYMEKIEGIDFGRYNDDMRIFAKDKFTAKRAMLAIQERLLTKGLNLNSAKTEFAKDEDEVEELRTKAYEFDEYLDDDEDALVTRPAVADTPFDEFDRDFDEYEELKSAKDAKDFCHFLAKRITLAERITAHIESLHKILTEWHGSAKHAAWRLVESIARSECPQATRERAEKVLIECLKNPSVTDYAKYRLLHHLTRLRRSGGRYCEQLERKTLQELRIQLPGYLAEKAFELNIIAMHTMQCLGIPLARIKDAVEEHAIKPVPLPIKNVLSETATPRKARKLPEFAPLGDEEAEIEDYY